MNMQLYRPAVGAAETYNAASSHWHMPPLAFWEGHGRGAVERAEIEAGEAVLDLGCGAGAGALEAARCVGPTGYVLGVDCAERMIALAAQRGAAEALEHATFQVGDMEDIRGPGGHYDVVLMTFSLTYAIDMDAFVARAYRLLRPGGRLVITTWAAGAFEPMNATFERGLCGLRPELVYAQRRSDRLSHPDLLAALFDRARLPQPEIEFVNARQPIWHPSELWTVAMGSSYRATIDRLSPEDREILRAEMHMAKGWRRGLAVPCLHAVARRA